MKNLNIQFYLLLMSVAIMIWFCIYLLHKKDRKQLSRIFILDLACTLIISIGVLFQVIFTNFFNADPFIFEKFIYIGTCFFPVCFLLTSSIFINTKLVLTSKHKLLFILPLISLIILWTNNYHHLFYQSYSIDLQQVIFGPYFYIHTLYSYSCILIAIFRLMLYSIKNSGFFSKQSLLICTGSGICLAMNILSTLGILNSSIYTTPIAFTIAILFIAFAIFKFDFLKVTPIALQRVVDRMSDGYIIVNDENIVTDFNQTFLDLFSLKTSELRNININDLITKLSSDSEKRHTFLDAISQTRSNDKTIKIERYFSQLNKYFNIEVNSIKNKNTYLGTLILFKDITQHTIDMQTIKSNQDMLIEKERLASLGQMIGGIAHNLKTPIMSIAGAAEGLSDLIKEYDASIGDPEVTIQDHHDIAKDMNEWIDKIRTHLSYMSDVITAIKGQAVAFSEQTSNGFTVKELINYVDILMKHELKNALINLNAQANIDVNTSVKGNINSLVQVINNIISNAIQAYQSQGKSNENINFIIYKENSNIVFKIEDFAGGLPETVQEKLFKEMVTTKGKNGTGLGLFMSYSNIKAHFNGNLKYETIKGKGTTFFIEIPM
jgi:two-component system, NtrC family, sensor histidine kinase HupT/HoxJ